MSSAPLPRTSEAAPSGRVEAPTDRALAESSSLDLTLRSLRPWLEDPEITVTRIAAPKRSRK